MPGQNASSFGIPHNREARLLHTRRKGEEKGNMQESGHQNILFPVTYRKQRRRSKRIGTL